MQVTFIGDPQELANDLPPSRNFVDMYGKHFRVGAVVDCSDLSDEQKRKLERNNHFKVVVAAKPAPVADSVADDAGEGSEEIGAERAAPAPTPKKRKGA